MSSSWEVVFNYYRDLGFPSELLTYDCISQKDATVICEMIAECSPNHILEVGTFVGVSTLMLAMASSDTRRIICVDPNLPVDMRLKDFGLSLGGGCIKYLRDALQHFNQADKVIIYEGFFSSFPLGEHEQCLLAWGVYPKMLPLIGNRIAEWQPFDFVFIDGDHSAESVYSDLLLIDKYVTTEATILLHDTEGIWAEQVLQGIYMFRELRPLYSFTLSGSLGILKHGV